MTIIDSNNFKSPQELTKKAPNQDGAQLEDKIDSALFVQHAHVMPSSVVAKNLGKYKAEHGLPASMKRLGEICDQKRARYISVPEFPPKAKKDSFLHIIKVPNPSPQPTTSIGDIGEHALAPAMPSGLLNMMEPSLAPSENIGGRLYSNAELLVLDQEQFRTILRETPNLSDIDRQRISAKKAQLDNFYKNKAYFIMNGKIVTRPTTPYAANQFIIISGSDRKDLLEQTQNQTTYGRFLTPPVKGRRQSIAAFAPERAAPGAALRAIKTSINPNQVVDNRSDVASMASILNDLDTHCMVGQSSPDIASDPNYQHFHVFLDVPDNRIPGFTAPVKSCLKKKYKDANGVTQKMSCARLNSKAFNCSTVYKVSCTSNDAHTVEFLKQIQNDFLHKENALGSALCLVGRRTDHGFEYYFILKKDMRIYPHLKQETLATGSAIPGWAEMMGIRIGTQEILARLPDEQYKTAVLKPFDVGIEENERFEEIVAAAAAKL